MDERNNRVHALKHDAAPVAGFDPEESFRKPSRQGSTILRAQPESEQVPPPLGLGSVTECSTVVEHLVVMDELDVAALELHLEVDRGVIRRPIEHVECCDLSTGQIRQEAKRCADSM